MKNFLVGSLGNEVKKTRMDYFMRAIVALLAIFRGPAGAKRGRF